MSKKTKKITYCAVLIAITVLFGTIFSFYLTDQIKISIGPAVVMFAGAAFGPVFGGVTGGIADFIASTIKNSGAYSPLFSITYALYGVLAGLLLYRKNIGLLKTTLSVTLIQILCSGILNTLWQSLLYGTLFLPLFLTRLPGMCILCIIYIIIINLLLRYKSKIIRVDLN